MIFITRYKLLLLCFSLCRAAPVNPGFRYPGIAQGLSNNAVTCLMQDRYGFIWIGTYNGLNRYDSAGCISFTQTWGDPSTLGNNHINQLMQDSGARIWAGTQQDVACYDYATGKFSPLRFSPGRGGSTAVLQANSSGLVILS